MYWSGVVAVDEGFTSCLPDPVATTIVGVLSRERLPADAGVRSSRVAVRALRRFANALRVEGVGRHGPRPKIEPA